MSGIVIANPFKVQLLTAKKPLLRLLQLRIYQQELVITGDTVTADFNEANYPGYVTQSLAWPTNAFLRPDGRGQVNSENITLRMTGAVPHNTLYGYFFTDSQGFFAYGGPFSGAPAIQFDHTGAQFTFAVRFLEDTMRL